VIAAAHVVYDLGFAAHLLAVLATAVVLGSLRLGASQVSVSGATDESRHRFPDRADLAARVLHLIPLTGLIVVVTGPANDGARHAWVILGLLGYLVAAGVIEARALPAERRLARALADGRDPTPEARLVVKNIDMAAAVLAVVLLVMVLQP
jgi:hypothetical protein